MNTMIAATLIDANQNSNSPYDLTESRLITVITDSSTRPMTQTGAGIQRCRMAAPATASTATTITQKYQYSQPLVKPAQLPRPMRAYSVNEPTPGTASAISPSMRMTISTTMPATRYDTHAAGPTVASVALLPTKRPAPIMPPSAIIVTCRCRSAAP